MDAKAIVEGVIVGGAKVPMRRWDTANGGWKDLVYNCVKVKNDAGVPLTVFTAGDQTSLLRGFLGCRVRMECTLQTRPTIPSLVYIRNADGRGEMMYSTDSQGGVYCHTGDDVIRLWAVLGGTTVLNENAVPSCEWTDYTRKKASPEMVRDSRGYKKNSRQARSSGSNDGGYSGGQGSRNRKSHAPTD